jgi:hypothetical protein
LIVREHIPRPRQVASHWTVSHVPLAPCP